MAGGHRTSATVLALMAVTALPTVAALTVSVAPVSASVVAAPAVHVPVGRPAVEQAQRTPIIALPSPCATQARRLSETQQALEVSSGPDSLIEVEDAALIAQVLIAQCGWTDAQVIEGRL